MSKRRSRLDARQPKWWDALFLWCDQYDVDIEGPMYCDLFDIMLQAIAEDKAVEMGSLGGLRGGKARALAMTAEQRSEAASKAARARWSK